MYPASGEKVLPTRSKSILTTPGCNDIQAQVLLSIVYNEGGVTLSKFAVVSDHKSRIKILTETRKEKIG